LPAFGSRSAQNILPPALDITHNPTTLYLPRSLWNTAIIAALLGVHLENAFEKFPTINRPNNQLTRFSSVSISCDIHTRNASRSMRDRAFLFLNPLHPNTSSRRPMTSSQRPFSFWPCNPLLTWTLTNGHSNYRPTRELILHQTIPCRNRDTKELLSLPWPTTQAFTIEPHTLFIICT
jgi:hypothetical protein